MSIPFGTGIWRILFNAGTRRTAFFTLPLSAVPFYVRNMTVSISMRTSAILPAKVIDFPNVQK